MIDHLTGLANRSFLNYVLQGEIARASRHGEPLSLLMADIDHFKNVNDTHGHATGDRVLKAVAQAIRQSCRSSDTPARLGGEEFVLVLPQTTRAVAALVAERIRNAVASLAIPTRPNLAVGDAVQVTISIGIGRFPKDADDASSLLRHADENLYKAKLAGRNRIAQHARHRTPLYETDSKRWDQVAITEAMCHTHWDLNRGGARG